MEFKVGKCFIINFESHVKNQIIRTYTIGKIRKVERDWCYFDLIKTNVKYKKVFLDSFWIKSAYAQSCKPYINLKHRCERCLQ